MSLECSYCGEEFKDDENYTPKILKCGDTFCMKCIEQISTNEEITCPICKQKSNQKKEDIPTNKYAIAIKKSILCDKCLGEYSTTLNGEKVPKVLKCGDTFCLACIKQLYKENVITCPFCGIETTDDINDMPNNKCIIDKAEHELYNNIKYLTDVNKDLTELDYQYSLGLMGEGKGGKTSITHYFHTGQSFGDSPIQTVGFDYHYKFILINKKLVKVTLWDTAGQERFCSISAGALRGVHGLLLVFALTIENNHKNYNQWKNSKGEEKQKIEEEFTQQKFKGVEFWLEQFYQFNQQEKRIIYLIGNKVDDVENRIIKKKDASQFASLHDLKYFETSAKTGENIFKVFSNLIIDLIKIYPNKIEKRGEKLKAGNKNKTKGKKSCCKNG